MATLGTRLRELRLQHKMGQKEVGAILGLSDASIRKYESNERTPSPDAIKKLATLFGVSTDYLLAYTTPPGTLPLLSSKDKRDIAHDLEEMMRSLSGEASEEKNTIAFYGQPMDEDAKELLRISLENSLKIAKQMAKKKFTPKKYRV